MSTKKIAVIIGSLRKESFNRKMANALIKIAPTSLDLEILEIKDLALYNQDLDQDPPNSWIEFRNKLKHYDGFLFLTPEYNRSFSAAMKNAIDVGSRPPSKNAWNAKPGAIVSVTPGSTGAMGANNHLRQSLMAVNILTMALPEAYIGNAATLFDSQGGLIGDSIRGFMKKFMDAFAAWVDTTAPKPEKIATRPPESFI